MSQPYVMMHIPALTRTKRQFLQEGTCALPGTVNMLLDLRLQMPVEVLASRLNVNVGQDLQFPDSPPPS